MARRNSRGSDRTTRWSGGNFVFNAITAGTAALTLVTFGTANTTLIRLRGNLVAWIDGNEAPPVGLDVAIGAIVMPEGQGSTVLSSPVTDDDAPWLFYERFAIGYEEYVIDVIDAPGLTVFRKEIDVKAMRILRPDREVQLVMEQSGPIGNGAVNILVNFRALFLEH